MSKCELDDPLPFFSRSSASIRVCELKFSSGISIRKPSRIGSSIPGVRLECGTQLAGVVRETGCMK